MYEFNRNGESSEGKVNIILEHKGSKIIMQGKIST